MAVAIALIATVAIETIAIATVNLTTVTIATVIVGTVIRSFLVLLGGVNIDSRCMADCYSPAAVGGGGGGGGRVLIIWSLPSLFYYLFYHLIQFII